MTHGTPSIDVLEQRLAGWIAADAFRLAALRSAAELDLGDWCIAAGFVRNLVWDRLHARRVPAPLEDVDLVYFDHDDTASERDRELEAMLRARVDASWSVKNQARMHKRNGDAAYRSTCHAMSFWPEIETAAGVWIDERQRIRVVAPFGIAALFAGSITPNTRCRDACAFRTRLAQKRWLYHWPGLTIAEPTCSN